MPHLIERELDLPAAPADVWHAITDPQWLSGWLADVVAIELRPGGEARFEFGDEVRDGWVEEVSAPEGGSGRLAFWWARSDEPASRVELALTAIDDHRTRLRVTETRPLEILDLVGIPFGGPGGLRYGPALVAA
jgi:uncharacterized protein YndB with AHSA1/START domain